MDEIGEPARVRLAMQQIKIDLRHKGGVPRIGRRGESFHRAQRSGGIASPDGVDPLIRGVSCSQPEASRRHGDDDDPAIGGDGISLRGSQRIAAGIFSANCINSSIGAKRSRQPGARCRHAFDGRPGVGRWGVRLDGREGIAVGVEAADGINPAIGAGDRRQPGPGRRHARHADPGIRGRGVRFDDATCPKDVHAADGINAPVRSCRCG